MAEEEQREGLLPDDSGHPPIFSKKSKTSKRPKKGAKRQGGVETLETMFGPTKPSFSADVGQEPKPEVVPKLSDLFEGTPAGGDDKSMISREAPEVPQSLSKLLSTNTGSKTTGSSGDNSLDKAGSYELPLRPGITVTGPAEEGATVTEQAQPAESVATVPTKGYSNEARIYHARYADLSQAHDETRYQYCREGCLDLLTEPNVPRYTRVQVLRMVSTLLKPAAAKSCLLEAEAVLDSMDQSKFQVQLLKDDNKSMLTDLDVWRGKKDLLGKDIEEWQEEGDAEDDRPKAAWFKFDADMEAKLDKETQEELEPFGRYLPSLEKAREDKGKDPETSKKTLPSPPTSYARPSSPLFGSQTGLASPGESEEEV